mgnify:CR=1 FL=1
MNYVAPEMEVLEVMVETGFAGSTEDPNGGVNPGIGGWE